jgi:23S rRNA (cytosine1962-C5)-methyltransferase
VEDAKAFVQRELRRGNRYDGILMDPPSYGRGPYGEVWKLEDELYRFAALCAQALSDQPLFYLINGYTTGFAASVLGNIARRCMGGAGKVAAEELALTVRTGGVLPCGATARWTPDV